MAVGRSPTAPPLTSFPLHGTLSDRPVGLPGLAPGPFPGRKQTMQRTETRRRILDAALHLFSQKGYHHTRMDDIVRASGVSKGGVYHHFPGKETLFFTLMDEFAGLLEQRLRRAVDQAPSDTARLTAALEEGMRLLERYHLLAKIVFVQASGLGPAFEGKRLDLLERLARFVREELDRAVARGLIPPLDTDVVAHAWVGALYEWAVRWLLTGAPAPQEVLPELRAFFLRSLGHPAAPSSTSSGEPSP